MVQSPTLRWSVCLFLFLACLIDVVWASRFDVISPILRTFRNRKRQGGTPGPVPQSSIPSTVGYPGLGPCVWASTNAWEGCGLNDQGALGYNASNCNTPSASVIGLAPPYKNCVAIAWFEFEDWASSNYEASTAGIPLSKDYNYALSISANVILNSVDVYNGKSGSKSYDKVTSQSINNMTTIFSFQLSRDGIVHVDIQYDYGHPSGNFTLWQQPKDLNSVASYASLSRQSTSTSQSYPPVSTAFTITTGTIPIISLGLNTSVSSAPQSATPASSYNPLGVDLNGTESAPSFAPATTNSTTMSMATIANSSTSPSSMPPATMNSTAMSMATIANSSTSPSSMPPATMNSTAVSMATTANSSTSLPSIAPVTLSSNATLSAFAAYTPYTANSTSTVSSTTMSFMPNASTTVPRTTINRFSPISSPLNNGTEPLSRPANSTTMVAVPLTNPSTINPSTRPNNVTVTPPTRAPSNSSVLAPSIKLASSSANFPVAKTTNSSAIFPSRPSSTPAASTLYSSTIAFSFSSSQLSSSSQTFLSNTSFSLQETPSFLKTNTPNLLKTETPRFLSTDTSSTPTLPVIDPPSTPISLTIDSPSAAPNGIPLWGRCGPDIGQVCADGAQCICKDQYWSQCRIQIGGLWAPRGENWECSGPAAPVRDQGGTVVAASATPAPAVGILPLWYQCGPGILGTCVQGTECICQNSFYSQCRVPIDGNWAGGYNWECNSPGQVPVAS